MKKINYDAINLDPENVKMLINKINEITLKHYITKHDDGAQSIDNYAAYESIVALIRVAIGTHRAILELLENINNKADLYRIICELFCKKAKEVIYNTPNLIDHFKENIEEQRE